MPKSSISELRRRELGRAAYETTCERGFAGMTLELVAQHAGISKGVIQHHFANKKHLTEEMVRYANRSYSETVRKRMKAARSLSEKLWCIIDCLLQPGLFEPQLVGAYLPVLVTGIDQTAILRIYDAMNMRGRSSMTAILKKWLDPNEARRVSYIIWNLLEGAWILPASQQQIARTAILQAIADYLKHIPQFDASVVDVQQSPETAHVHTELRIPISTIRRMELEKAALDILYESGFRDLTVQRVADKAQLSKGVVHHYFLSKEDLIAGALRHEFRQFGVTVAQLLRRTNTSSERLWTVVVAQFADQYIHFSYIRWYLNSLEAGFRNPSIAKIYDIADRRGRSNLAFALKQLMNAEDAHKTALTLWNMIVGVSYAIFSDRSVTHENVLLTMAEYLTNSIPAFDTSVVRINGAKVYDKRAPAVKSIEREHIYNATVEVIEHVGCRKFSFELLAEHMGIPLEAIQPHYRRFQDLIAATVRYSVARVEEIAEHRRKQARSASEALWAVVYSDVEPTIITRRATEVYLSFLEAGMGAPQILEIYESEEEMRRSALASELTTLLDGSGVDMVLANLTAMLQGAWGLLPCDPDMTQSDILKSMSEYLICSVPGFDASALKLSAQWREETGAPTDQ